MVAINETVENLFKDINFSPEHRSENLERLLLTDNRYLKDLRINVSNALNSENLSRKEAYLIAYAVGLNEKHRALANAFEALARQAGASEEEISEAVACTSLLNVNNVYYRFKHFLNKDYYNQAPAGIKMSIMMKPVLGKEFFELLSLAVSALNGCEMCVNAHEESVIKHGSTQPRVLEAVRLAAVIKGLAVIV